MVTTQLLLDYLLDNSPWVDRAKTVDTVKFGDPETEIRKAGVCWYPSMKTIRAAQEEKCQLLICHEPLLWEHAAAETQWRDKSPGREKIAALEETGMTVLRVHDSWDQWPKLGIRDSWANWLGLHTPVYTSKDHNYHAIYEIEERTLEEFARHVAHLVRRLGEDTIRVMGDPRMVVRRPALGVGCLGPDEQIVEAGADALIVCYDGAPYWSVRERFFEMGVAVIMVEHGTTETPGMKSLCQHLWMTFPDCFFQFFDEHPRPWTVAPY